MPSPGGKPGLGIKRRTLEEQATQFSAMCKPLMRPLILQARFFLVAKPPGTRLSRNLHTQKTLAPLWLRGRSSPYPHGVRLPLYPWILEPLTLSSNKHGSPSGPETAATGPRAQSRVPRREVTGGSRAPTNSARREDPRRERGCTPRQVAPPSPEVGPGTFSPRATRGSKAGIGGAAAARGWSWHCLPVPRPGFP